MCIASGHMKRMRVTARTMMKTPIGEADPTGAEATKAEAMKAEAMKAGVMKVAGLTQEAEATEAEECPEIHTGGVAPEIPSRNMLKNCGN